MFVIFEEVRNYYFSQKEKIIVFDSIEKATAFAEGFYQYAFQRAMQENPFLIPKVMQSKSSTSIREANFDFSIVETINFDELVE